MSPETIPQVDEAPIIKYEPSQEALAEIRCELAPIIEKATDLVRTSDGYEQVRKSIGTLRTMRGDVERKRIQLKAKALEYGRAVDSKAKQITAQLMEMENPLKAAKDVVDHEKAEAERKAEEERLKALKEIQEAQLRAEREKLDEERRRLDTERRELEEHKQVELAKVVESQRIERERLEAEQTRMKAERDKLEAERRANEEVQRRENERLEAEKRKIQAEKERLDRIEFERVTREKAEAEAKVRAEKEARLKAEAEERAAKERAAEAKRREELRPDLEKIKAYGQAMRDLPFPKIYDAMAKDFLTEIRSELFALADKCSSFR